jgi:hypothetical protein
MWRRVDLEDSLQPPAHAGSLLADISTMKMEAIGSSETLVHTRSTRRHIPEDSIFQNIFSSLIREFVSRGSGFFQRT